MQLQLFILLRSCCVILVRFCLVVHNCVSWGEGIFSHWKLLLYPDLYISQPFARLLMRHSLWLIVSLMGVRVDGEKEEFDLVPSGCCDWPSCYDPRTQVIQMIWNPLNTCNCNTWPFLFCFSIQLCLDACRSLWTQCPSKLVLLSCYSKFRSFQTWNVELLSKT